MKNDDRSLIEYINKNIGFSADNMSMMKGFGDVGGSSTASLEIYILDSEERPSEIKTTMLAQLIREKTGEIIGAERFTLNDAANFGGSPVSISLLSETNNLNELKKAKDELLINLKNHPLLTDVSNNDPEGIKEIQIKLKENAYLSGLDFSMVMYQIRSAFFGIEAQRFQRGDDEIKVWVRYDKKSM